MKSLQNSMQKLLSSFTCSNDNTNTNNITSILELAVEVGKRNCKRLYNFISNGKIFKRYTFSWDGMDTMLLVIS